jgi:methyltransferase FkbM-like protein
MYSQNEEEKYILEACKGIRTVDGKVGRFLDIGAYHPKKFSNTRALYELGWHGVMYEPSPGPMLELIKEYGREDRITLVSAAVGLKSALVELWVTDECYSTTVPGNYEKWKNTAHFSGVCNVLQVSVDQVLGTFFHDFVSIDAEGTSVELFLAALGLGWPVQCYCVEHDGRLAELELRARASGYRLVYSSAENGVFVRSRSLTTG